MRVAFILHPQAVFLRILWLQVIYQLMLAYISMVSPIGSSEVWMTLRTGCMRFVWSAISFYWMLQVILPEKPGMPHWFFQFFSKNRFFRFFKSWDKFAVYKLVCDNSQDTHSNQVFQAGKGQISRPDRERDDEI